MPHHIDLYVRSRSPLHALDPRAKLVAVGGFVAAALVAPVRPLWPATALALLLLAAAALGRLPVRTMLRRALSPALVIGVPFALSRLGGEQARAAGEAFALKSLLTALAFAVLMATTRAVTIFGLVGRAPLLKSAGELGEFILRGADLLAEEVVRTNRAWRLRAPAASPAMRLRGLTAASISLVARAAARSERVGAAMVLRGFHGAIPAPQVAPPAWSHLAAGAAFAALALALGGAGRWL